MFISTSLGFVHRAYDDFRPNETAAIQFLRRRPVQAGADVGKFFMVFGASRRPMEDQFAVGEHDELSQGAAADGSAHLRRGVLKRSVDFLRMSPFRIGEA